MKPRRIVALMHRELVPPDSLEGVDEAEMYRWQMEYDVLNALRSLGHEALPLGVTDELAPIRTAIDEFKPHVVFNLLGHFQGITAYDAYVISWLELRHVAYTGCNPRGLMLSTDKVLAKKVLSWHRIPVPGFALFARGRSIKKPRRLTWPLFVKSAAEHASVGIAQASVVHNEDALQERVKFVHEVVGTDAMAEEYIEGRELSVGVIGNQRLTVFPTWEITFGKLPKGAEPIVTSRVKWDTEYQKKVDLRAGPAKNLPEDVEARIPRLARRIFRALGLSGYARIDLRLDDAGRLFVLEANANPDISLDEDFASAAKKVGLEYDALIQRITSLGLRYAPPWKESEG